MLYVQSGYWVDGYAVGDSNSSVVMQCDLTTVKSGIQSLNDNMQLMYDDLIQKFAIQNVSSFYDREKLNQIISKLDNFDIDVDLSPVVNGLNQVNTKLDNLDVDANVDLSSLEQKLNVLSATISSKYQRFESLNGLYGSLKDNTRVKIADSALVYVVVSSFLLRDKNSNIICYNLKSNNQNVVVTQNQILNVEV